MNNKTELIRLAAELKSLADRLIDCAKEDTKEEKKEGDDPKPDLKNNHAMIGLMLKKKLGK